MTDEHDYRLPRTVVPRRYELTLSPDLAAATFSGEAAIEVDIADPARHVVVNAVDLEIDQAWLVDAYGTQPRRVGHARPCERAGRLRARRHCATRSRGAARPLPRVLNDQLRGFYRSTFKDEAGNDKVIAVTQFESTSARRAFPCWDEPDLKAIFSITLVVDGELTALANTKQISDERTGDGRRRVRFADTMPLSTYLVAFIVGELEITEPIDVDGVPMRIVHQPGKRALAGFAEECGVFATRFFADYFGIPFPTDKLDLVGLPDFAAGAMENLGLVTFREALLLVDPATATQAEELVIANVVAHEIAHMWFGDLVTMRWWNGLWLKEAFATFMAQVCIDAMKPEWHVWDTFGLDRTAALETDALESTRAIEYPVHSPHDAEGMYDVLTYEKGAAVLRMLEQYLGADEFRAGVRAYLSKHAYGNTENTDLWDAIEAATSEPARRIMDAWIFQGGYPLVRVSPGPDGQLGASHAATLRLLRHRRRDAVARAAAHPPERRWRDDEHPPSARQRARRHLARGSRRRRARERGGPRLPPRALRGAFPRPARRSGARGDVDDRALQPRRRRLGCGRGRRGIGDGVSSTSRAASATSRRCPCGRRCLRAWASATGSSTTPRRVSSSARSSAAWPAPRCTGSGGRRGTGRTTSPASCADCSSAQSRSSVTIATRRPRRVRCTSSHSTTPRRSHPRSRAPR